MLPGKVGGTETYVRGLVHAISQVDKKNEYVLFTRDENHRTFEYNSDKFSKILCPVPAKNRLTRVAYEQLFLPKLVVKHGVDVLHYPGYVSPVVGKFGKVVTIHDMQYVYYPGYFSKTKLLYWKYLLPLSATRSDVILTVSENTKADIANFLNIPKNKIFVTYEAPKFCADSGEDAPLPTVMKKYGIRHNYILSVASLLPHKNLDRLIEAFALLEDKIDHQLVLAGIKGHALDEIRKMIGNKLKQPSRVAILGYISNQDLEAIYKRASLFILPSLFEGFGIPLLEAMSLGCPVAASNKTSIPEVVGDAALLFDPNSANQIAEAIFSVVSDKTCRERLIDRGRQRVKLFSWEKMAGETIDAYSVAYELFQKIR
jgi:glycosyltransferase involved in cell wall biosynthesis